jgi:hypothetical protein
MQLALSPQSQGLRWYGHGGNSGARRSCLHCGQITVADAGRYEHCGQRLARGGLMIRQRHEARASLSTHCG